LIASIEGRRGMPRPRPPFPVQSGIQGKPTCINNVETLASVAPIVRQGGAWFAGIGTEKSKGTKVFALAGKVNNTGLVEVPMGIPLRRVVFDIGGGIPGGLAFKAVQTGGPSGGCIPAEHLDLAVDYDSLAAVGSIMGSGGMIVADERTCMVDFARFFLEFIQDESCGKCVPCRIGTRRMLEIVQGICDGTGTPEDVAVLEELASSVRDSSLCGLGQTAPNPVLTTLRYFRDEYRAHIEEHRCPALVCKSLIRYDILPDKCTGCMACRKPCPTAAITGERKQVHLIEQEKCIKCGMCFSVCRFDAVGIS
jgi:NADH:ubiquinone oxidoreductase subunit F (NADH-binding)/NAD-dependent dihydropyrimidine dehydrogenase PreA subunit